MGQVIQLFPKSDEQAKRVKRITHSLKEVEDQQRLLLCKHVEDMRKLKMSFVELFDKLSQSKDVALARRMAVEIQEDIDEAVLVIAQRFGPQFRP